MTYTPNADDATNPTDAVPAETATAEFQALKTKLNAMLGTYNSGAPVWISNMVLPSATLSNVALTGVPTAPTAAPGTNTAQVATMAALLAQAMSSTIPTDNSNNGKYLSTVGGIPAWATLAITGQGGDITGTGNVTLTSASAGAQSIAVTTFGQYVTLPDATTMAALGASVFNIKTSGLYFYGIKDAAGNKLGWIRPNDSCSIGLADKSTSAGSWTCAGLSKAAVTATMTENSLSVFNQIYGYACTCALDANRTAIFVTDASTHLYGIVYNAAVQQWGSWTLLSSAVGCTINTWPEASIAAVPSNAGQALVAQADGANSSVHITSVLSSGVNGLTLSLGVHTQFGIAATSCYFRQQPFIYVGGTWVIGYSCNGTGYCFPFTINGAGTSFGLGSVKTIGTGASVFMTSPSPTVLRTFVGANGNATAQSYTVSGVSLTPGTPVTSTTSTNNYRFILLGNGDVMAINSYAGAFSAIVFKLTGTVEAATNVTKSATGPSANFYQFDIVAVASNAVAVFSSTSTGWACTIFTDTAGTVSGNTLAGVVNTVGSPRILALPITGTTAYFYFASGGNFTDVIVSFDCSTATPVLKNWLNFTANLTYNAGPMNMDPIPQYPDNNENRGCNVAIAGQSIYYMGGSQYGDAIKQVYPTGARIITEFNSPLNNYSSAFNATFSDAASNGVWCTSSLYASAQVGTTFTKVEFVG